jgi:hypothetical protein
MTAAHAREYEVPEHGTPPVEAVEQAERGHVVYLTRGGHRFAAVVPPSVAERGNVDDVEAFWEGQEDATARACRTIWAAAADEDASTRDAIRASIERIMDAIEDASDVEVARVVQAAGDPPVPWEHARRDLGL